MFKKKYRKYIREKIEKELKNKGVIALQGKYNILDEFENIYSEHSEVIIRKDIGDVYIRKSDNFVQYYYSDKQGYNYHGQYEYIYKKEDFLKLADNINKGIIRGKRLETKEEGIEKKIYNKYKEEIINILNKNKFSTKDLENLKKMLIDNIIN